jgi:hypothetical protein
MYGMWLPAQSVDATPPRRATAVLYLCKLWEISSGDVATGSTSVPPKSINPPAPEHHDLRRQPGCFNGVALT